MPKTEKMQDIALKPVIRKKLSLFNEKEFIKK